MLYPVQGELGSDPCPCVFLVKLSDTESNFRYKDGFFTDSGCKTNKRIKSEAYFYFAFSGISQIKHTAINRESSKHLIHSSNNMKYSRAKRSQSSPCTQSHSLALTQKDKTKFQTQKKKWRDISAAVELWTDRTVAESVCLSLFHL